MSLYSLLLHVCCLAKLGQATAGEMRGNVKVDLNALPIDLRLNCFPLGMYIQSLQESPRPTPQWYPVY